MAEVGSRDKTSLGWNVTKQRQILPQVLVVGEEGELPSQEKMCRALSPRRSYHKVSYETHGNCRFSDDACSVPTVNLTGVVLVAAFIVMFSWFLDELYDSFHESPSWSEYRSIGEDGSIHTVSLSAVGWRGSTSLAVARAGLALCILFVVAVWGASAYIKVKYLTPKEDQVCPHFSW